MALFRHVASGTTTGEIWTFTLHTEGSSAIADAADAWQTATGTPFWDVLAPSIAPDVEMTRATTVTLDTGTGAQIERRDRDVSRPGTSSSSSLPYQVSLAVTLRAENATRRGRGRFYLPPFAEGTQDGGRLTGGVQDDVANAALGMIQSLASNGLVAVLLSRDTMQTRDIVTLDVGDVLDTQRRRRNQLTESRVSETV